MPLLFDIRRFSVHDGPGIRTTVFFKGCTMSCAWCHNPESRNPVTEQIIRRNPMGELVFEVQETIGKSFTTEEVMTEVLRDRPFYEESGGGVTFSGGEPLYQPEALKELLKACRELQIHTAIDTCGFAPYEIFQDISQYADLFLFDIKHSDDQKHIEYTGVSNKEILRNLQGLCEKNKAVIVRIPMIMGVNCDEENLQGSLRIMKEIKSVLLRIDLLPYHRLGESKYLGLKMENKVFDDLPDEVLQHWQDVLKSNGLINIVGG